MGFQLTSWALFLLFGCLQALLLAGIFIFRKRGAKISNRCMTLFLLIFAAILFDHSLRLSELYKVFPWGLYISDSLWYLVGPLMWLYVKYRVDNRFSKWEYLHFIPFLIFALIYGKLPLLDASVKVRILESYFAAGSTHNIAIKIFILIMMTQMLIYFILSIVFIIRTEEKYKKASSGSDIVDFITLKRIILFFGVYFLFEFSFSTFRNFSNIQNRFIENWSLVMWTLFMIALVVAVVTSPNTIFEIIKLKTSANATLDIVKIKERLLSFMESEQPYLNDSLTLPDIATSVGVSTNQLSFVLNKGMKTSFYDFVNKYRAQHSAKQFDKGLHEKLSIFGIAQASGFKSKASFYSFFKKEYGTTPKGYIQHNHL